MLLIVISIYQLLLLCFSASQAIPPSKYEDFLVSKHLKVPRKDLKIAIASCHDNFRKKNDIFEKVIEYEPDLYVWLGDAVYLDGGNKSFNWWKMKYQNVEKSLEQKLEIFNSTFNDKLYSEMRDRFPIIGVWDDHDMGLDNQGKHYKNKQFQKQLFLNFLQEPSASERRNDTLYEGVYYDYYVQTEDKSVLVHIILLDARYNLEHNVDVLGEQQWNWLDAKLQESQQNGSNLILLGSGIQFLNFDNFFLSEAWDYQSRIRLLQTLNRNKASYKTVFLSGDVHYAQFLKTPCRSATMGQYFHEFSSSGMTHNCQTYEYDCKGLLSHVYTNIWKDSPYYMYFNFGGIEVKRVNKNEIEVEMSIIDINGDQVIKKGLVIKDEKKEISSQLDGKYKVEQSFTLKMQDQCFHRITERKDLNYYLTQMEAIVTHKSSYRVISYLYYYLTSSIWVTTVIWLLMKPILYLLKIK